MLIAKQDIFSEEKNPANLFYLNIKFILNTYLTIFYFIIADSVNISMVKGCTTGDCSTEYLSNHPAMAVYARERVNVRPPWSCSI